MADVTIANTATTTVHFITSKPVLMTTLLQWEYKDGTSRERRNTLEEMRTAFPPSESQGAVESRKPSGPITLTSNPN